MKITIDSIYDDGYTLFTNNALLNSDDRLSDIMQYKNDLDLIAEMHFGARELLRRNIKADNEHVFVYDLSKISRHIYACMVENMTKYNTLLSTLEYTDVEPTKEYYEKYTHGENVKTRDVGEKIDTFSFGDVDTTTNLGASSESTTNGARENTASVTSFSSSTFEPTDKQNSASVTDTTQYGAQINTDKVTHGNDTKTYGAHQEVITDDETIDEKEGFKDLWANVERKRKLFDKSILHEIVAECINSISYSMYL